MYPTDTAGSIPILLKHHTICNGIVPVQVANLESIFKYCNTILSDSIASSSTALFFQFTVKYKLNYESSDWFEQSFDDQDIDENEKFYFKVPLFLLQYNMEYQLILKVIVSNSNDDNNDDDTFSTIMFLESDVYLTEIPSILIEKRFKIGDAVQYQVDNAAFVRSGIVIELLNNDIIRIKTDAGYQALHYEQPIYNIHKSLVSSYPIYREYLIDTTNSVEYHNDLIIRNKASIETYQSLREYFSSFYFDSFNKYMYDNEIIECSNDYICMANLLTINICKFLFKSEYNYRIYCIFSDNNYLYLEEQWKYNIYRKYINIRNNISTSSLQEFNRINYTCDICRTEISWFDFIFHCNSDNHIHDFCVSCVYSMVKQQKQMNKLLILILKNIINKDIIQEIVTFCVGKVIKFDIYDVNSNTQQNQTNDNYKKRKYLDNIDIPIAKRQRIQ